MKEFWNATKIAIVAGIVGFSGYGLGIGWYYLWWVYGRAPSPPLTRYFIPQQFVDYQIVRVEMIFWMTLLASGIALAIWSHFRTKRHQ